MGRVWSQGVGVQVALVPGRQRGSLRDPAVEGDVAYSVSRPWPSVKRSASIRAGSSAGSERL